ncbi:MAG: hypothetical protein CVU05_08160 [Bacteroidetes bacterium HGW-Bacteroidetes-21]|jgi:hypothetical protein|nr:MAG: hypothetical protein CVU05_08160 [Bacteroidetes bacterium HGW-Bacteroidetes-21]
MNRKGYILFWGLLFPVFLSAQSTISLDLFPVGMHLYDRSRSFLFENRIDYNGNAVVEPGVILTYEFFTKETKRGFQIQQGFYSDAAAQISAWTQFSFRVKLFHKYKHKVSLAAGPALVYRKGWYLLEGYADNPEDSYEPNGPWEFRWAVPVQLQYNYYTGSRSELNVSLLYHYERHTLFPSIGFKFWISTKVKNPADCNCNSSFKKKRLRDWF